MTNSNNADAQRRPYLILEYVALFFVIPLILALAKAGPFVFLALYSAFGLCLWLLLRDPGFERRNLWRSSRLREGLPRVLAIWTAAALAMAALVYYFRPEWWLYLPRNKTVLWAIIMVAYPIVSVYAQNVVYRAFIFHRYAPLFGPRGHGIVWASAAAFCVAHAIFHNWVALGLTAVGGLLFAHTYDKHRSLALASLEHALYGCAVFTVGLGQFIYSGRNG